jgi:hypothetical protein
MVKNLFVIVVMIAFKNVFYFKIYLNNIFFIF